MSRATCLLTAMLSAVMLISQGGCVVPQPQGKGLVTREVEPETQTGYWLYLPEDYVKNNGQRPDHQRWPLVVTFHGMKPYDNANPQIREWQQEADRYGFIVIAPELHTSDSFMQYPLRDPTLPYVQHDEKATLTIMDEVFRRTNADPTRVLSTSWSCGGYLAHYMVNRHPDRFSCMAVRQSNFGEEMLDAAQVPKYRNMKIGIFFGENDFKACREESREAVLWYRRHRFYVEAKKVSGLGHERTPQTAAAFFASTVGATPKTPPQLGTLVLENVDVGEPVAMVRRPPERRVPPPPTGSSGSVAASPAKSPTPAPNGVVFNNQHSPQPLPEPSKAPVRVAPPPRAPSPIRTAPTQAPTPKRPMPQPYSTTVDSPAPRTERKAHSGQIPRREMNHNSSAVPAKIRIEGEPAGPAPLWVTLGIDMPARYLEGASILWTDNDRPVATGTFTAKPILREPGDHTIRALIITADDREIRLSQNVKVFARASSRPAS